LSTIQGEGRLQQPNVQKILLLTGGCEASATQLRLSCYQLASKYEKQNMKATGRHDVRLHATSSTLGRKIVFGHGEVGTAGADAEGFRCPAPLPGKSQRAANDSPLKKLACNVYKEMFAF